MLSRDRGKDEPESLAVEILLVRWTSIIARQIVVDPELCSPASFCLEGKGYRVGDKLKNLSRCGWVTTEARTRVLIINARGRTSLIKAAL